MSNRTCPLALSRTTREPPIVVTSIPPSASGVSPFGLLKLRGGWLVQSSGAAPLADDALPRRDLQDPAVPDIGDRDVAVGERVGVVGRVQVAVGGAGASVMAVLPDDLAA